MGAKKGRILFTEDDQIDRMAFERMADKEDFPYNYIIAGSAKEAGNFLQSEKFDAVVMDYLLGDHTAFELFDKARGLPIIIVTGAGDEEIAVRALKAGAYDYLIKDPDNNHLKILPATVENAINRKRDEEELDKYRRHLENLVKERTGELQKEIDERRRAEDKIRLLAKYTSENPNPVLRIKNTGTVQYANKASEPILNELESKTGHFSSNEWMKLIKSIYDAQSSRELELQHKGKIFLITITPFTDTDYLYAYGRDITEHKQAEEELAKYRQHLESLVEERTDKLTKANEHLIQEITDRKQAEEKVKSSREKLRNLSIHLQSVREKERTRIAREIHDELGQLLTALKMNLSHLSDKLPPLNNPLLERTKTMSELIDVSIKTVQRISSDLRPSLLDDLGIIPAIEWHAKEFHMHTGIKCVVAFENFDMEELALDKERTTVIYRIFQETLTNIARHAKATTVKLNMKKNAHNLTLTIKDNGRGITKEEIDSSKSFGIIGIRERANFVGGKIDINGVAGTGTTVSVSIPFFRRKNNFDKNPYRR